MAETHTQPIVVLLGAAGSGKGTQAQMLVERHGYVKVDAGDVVRKKAKENSPLGREIKAISESGRNMPDAMIGDLIASYMQSIPTHKPLVIDGFPRTVGQDDILHDMFERIGFIGRPMHPVWLKIDLDEAKRRLLQRSMCTSCKTIFATRDITTCTVCGGHVEPRVDDQPEAIDRRIRFFQEGPMKAIERYQLRGHLHVINGDRTVEQVHADLVHAIQDKPGQVLPFTLK